MGGVARKNEKTKTDLNDPLEFETYVIKSTRKSKVPVKVEDPAVLRMVAGLLDTEKKAPHKGTAAKRPVPRAVVEVELPNPTSPPAPVEQRLQNLEGQMDEILSLLKDKK